MKVASKLPKSRVMNYNYKQIRTSDQIRGGLIMAERKIKLILGGYGKENEQAICFAEFDPENSSLRKISGIEGLSAPTYLTVLKKGEDRILYTFERSGQGGAVVALFLTEEGNR